MINEDYVVETFKEGDITLDVKVDYNSKIIWLSQKDMAVLLGVSSDNIGLHIKNITPSLSINNAFIGPITKDFSVVQTEGYRSVNRKIKHYNLVIILAVGYKCNPEITTVFKAWVEKLFIDYVQLENEGKWLSEAKNYEIVQFRDGEFCLDVNVSPQENTIWLDAEEIGLIFERDYKTILKHINNIFAENEVEQASNSQKMRLTGNSKPTIYYNFDVIIAVGYRVKSRRGTEFRKWATNVIKNYLFYGYSINKDRIIAYQSNILNLEADMDDVKKRINNIENTIYFNNDKLLFEGQIVEAYSFIRKIFFLAKNELMIIDNYADKFLLSMLEDIKISITIITSINSYLNKCEVKDNIKIINSSSLHGRYIIADEYVYLLDNSFNNIGKVKMVITKLEDIKKEYILKDLKY